MTVLIPVIVGVCAVTLGVLVMAAFARERARLAQATFQQGLAERERAAEVMHGTIREQAARLHDADTRLETAVAAEHQRAESAKHAQAALMLEVEHTRAALKRVQAEWAGLNAELVGYRTNRDTQLRDLMHERDRLHADLSAERMNAVSTESNLHAELARLREERTVLTMARDALQRERDMLVEAADRERTILRRRVHHAQQLVKRTRERADERVAAERQNGADLVRRLWEYLKPDHAPEMPPAEPLPASPAPVIEVVEREIPLRGETPAERPIEVEREIERPVEYGLADRAPVKETERTAGPKTPQSGNHEPPVDIGVTVHTVPSNLRRPLSVMQDGDTMRVVCDDGAVFERGPDGWHESAPLPGSRSDAIRKFQDGIGGAG